MKKIILFLLLLTCGLGLAGCLGKSDKADISNIVETSGVVDHVLIEERYTDSSTDAEETTEKWDLIPMVMVDDALYLDTGYAKEADKRPDTFEGMINLEVDRREKPTVNDQSNFGTGYGYRYGKAEGMIEIYMNDKWQVFATEKIIASGTLILDEQLTE